MPGTQSNNPEKPYLRAGHPCLPDAIPIQGVDGREFQP
jgi:hypothetical protein